MPHRPGPLVRLDDARRQRGRDDLDELIDDLLPDVDERPGAFDAALAMLGTGFLVWTWIGEAPAGVTVVGIIAITLIEVVLGRRVEVDGNVKRRGPTPSSDLAPPRVAA